MIDIHCHILPGVDDGSPDLETSLTMARIAQDNGIRAIIATPHCSRDFPEQNLLSHRLVNRFAALNEALSEHGLQVRVYPGMEVMVGGNFRELLEKGSLLPLAGTRYMLIEFDFDCNPEQVSAAVSLLLSKGYVPVIAHPERYYCVQWKPELAGAWQRAGAVLQLNRGSLQGKLSEQAEACAWHLLRRGNVALVASDAHGASYRRPELASILTEIASVFSWAYAAELLIQNPARILRNENLSWVYDGIRLPD